MPTVLRFGPYRFYFYSHEPNEPPHVHVDRDDLSAKFWLDPVALARNLGFNARELNALLPYIEGLLTGKQAHVSFLWTVAQHTRDCPIRPSVRLVGFFLDSETIERQAADPCDSGEILVECKHVRSVLQRDSRDKGVNGGERNSSCPHCTLKRCSTLTLS